MKFYNKFIFYYNKFRFGDWGLGIGFPKNLYIFS